MMFEQVNFALADWLPYGRGSIERYEDTKRLSTHTSNLGFLHDFFILAIYDTICTSNIQAFFI